MVDFPIILSKAGSINVDMQNCLVENSPIAAEGGRELLNRMNRLVDACHKTGILVVHTAHVVRAIGPHDSWESPCWKAIWGRPGGARASTNPRQRTPDRHAGLPSVPVAVTLVSCEPAERPETGDARCPAESRWPPW